VTQTIASQETGNFVPAAAGHERSALARQFRRRLLGPTYDRIMQVLDAPGSVDPRRVPEVVFEMLNRARHSRLQMLVAKALCLRARSVYSRRRAQSIALHYDLPSAFYQLFLDSRYAAYTGGIFDTPGAGLEEAQRCKFGILVGKLRPNPGDRVFELGSGWGAFLIYARETGLAAEGMALSREQVDHCQRQGLKVQFGDAAAGIPGPVDRLIAVGMFEHCKNQRAQILAQCFRALAPRGRMVIQEMCSGPHPGDPGALVFAVEEFFCGDVLGTYESVQAEARRAGFHVEHMECFGRHYVPTALEWARRLALAFPAAVAMVGYRTAMSHLIAQAGFAWSFAVGSLDLLQYVLVKPDAHHPRARERAQLES
jgi:cyclopropane-fatty-acyl-phospholipid synthase